MNQEKARELFSAYFEGNLESGLRQALDQRLRSDSALASDYAAFAETMKELGSLGDEEIEVPQFLSTRIATVVDQASLQPRKNLSWQNWFRGIALAGVAGAAAFAVFVAGSAGMQSTTETAVGTIGGPVVNADQLEFQQVEGGVQMKFHATGKKTVVLRSGIDGKELKRFNLDRKSVETKLDNPLPGTALFEIEVVNDNEKVLLALPGSARSTRSSGGGSLAEFAVAIAEFYKVPVLLKATSDTQPVAWDFKTSDPRIAATDSLSGRTTGVDQRPNGMLVIQ